ncbi:MAG: CsbD family protein [Euzebyaceae bacterium]|nr:CsbD family protein [Euzebyaceae bacterium]
MQGVVVSNTDDIKGRAKEATGKATGNKDLQREGKTDRASGKVKQGVDKVKDALKKKNR